MDIVQDFHRRLNLTLCLTAPSDARLHEKAHIFAELIETFIHRAFPIRGTCFIHDGGQIVADDDARHPADRLEKLS